ncbi:vacuolar protein sorting-associated protein [Chloropicon primus]|uniref:Vacuolar protein sorting-associated protein n=1 Tax=Chloropicon primus TaxID=1764295 RepID=A0A5B8MT86_9CHLO|nr:vacuolar protein sorting-associated protein [Chloropicon primus]UPR02749.1 vacuolar protein sorting-associated protein [Chloropicon primus]|mmetsp:Transcript_7753/g.22138  ORF Transcript_7753/g.22138 Transcript_7753/m.22138 type:complete len:189 (+) Transcript_7753:341-907(+)|eukprot:QDZ23537.1 vacuolar protein sorting-associated protein [Chloropicon primus]
MVDSSFFTSSSGGAGGAFEFPEIYSYPPFFTLQPVKETREKQLASWRDLIVKYARSERVFEFDPKTFALFENKAIQRALNETARQAIVENLTERGLCEKAGGGGGRVHLLWKSLSEWEAYLLDWAHRTGRREDVLTVDELCTSGELATEEFHGMTKGLMEKVLKRLEKQKKVMLFQGSDQDDQGVKFL